MHHYIKGALRSLEKDILIRREGSSLTDFSKKNKKKQTNTLHCLTSLLTSFKLQTDFRGPYVPLVIACLFSHEFALLPH